MTSAALGGARKPPSAGGVEPRLLLLLPAAWPSELVLLLFWGSGLVRPVPAVTDCCIGACRIGGMQIRGIRIDSTGGFWYVCMDNTTDYRPVSSIFGWFSGSWVGLVVFGQQGGQRSSYAAQTSFITL